MEQLNKFCDFSRRRKLGYWIFPKKNKTKRYNILITILCKWLCEENTNEEGRIRRLEKLILEILINWNASRMYKTVLVKNV